MKLYLGCGNDYKQGYTNVDYYNGKCDVKHDLNKFPYPFKKNSVDEVLFIHSLEYISNLISLFKELHRICKHNAIIKIIAPHFSNFQANSDFTYAHRGFSAGSFRILDSSHVAETRLKEKFKIEKMKIVFQPKHTLFFGWFNRLINIKPLFSEKWISKIIPFDETHIEIRVLKD